MCVGWTLSLRHSNAPSGRIAPYLHRARGTPGHPEVIILSADGNEYSSNRCARRAFIVGPAWRNLTNYHRCHYKLPGPSISSAGAVEGLVGRAPCAGKETDGWDLGSRAWTRGVLPGRPAVRLGGLAVRTHGVYSGGRASIIGAAVEMMASRLRSVADGSR